MPSSIGSALHPGEPGTRNLQLRVAMLDPSSGQPAIRLANEGRQPDGWYDMGTITIAGK